MSRVCWLHLSVWFINVAGELETNFRWHILVQILITRAALTWDIFGLKSMQMHWEFGSWGKDWITWWQKGFINIYYSKSLLQTQTTPRQLSHFSCRWAILMRLLCTFSTTKPSVSFLLKTSELNGMAKLMNYCIFFFPVRCTTSRRCHQHASCGGVVWS